MMRAVVTSGTAKPAHLQAGTAGKTGTAEYAAGQNGKQPPTHAWFIGFRGDVAFGVIVEGGGFGAKTAAPIAKRFLNAL
jgi:cell division protein FtsI/penicillin-binding protein 2